MSRSLDYFLLFLSFFFIGFGIGAFIVNATDKQKSDAGTIITQALSSTPKEQTDRALVNKYDFPPNSLSKQEKDLFLELHNEFRTKNNREPLLWDDYLSRSAEAYAQKLLKEGCAIYHPKTNKDDELYLQSGVHGQNLSQFVYTGKPKKGLKVGSIRKAVQLWRDECHEYDPKHPTKGNVGHFTAMLWKPTRRVGCAFKELHSKKKQASIYVCHYEKSGNWLTSHGGFELFDKHVGEQLICDETK
jgi:hypothetical protein